MTYTIQSLMLQNPFFFGVNQRGRVYNAAHVFDPLAHDDSPYLTPEGYEGTEQNIMFDFPLQNPLPCFFDKRGKPISGGKLFVKKGGNNIALHVVYPYSTDTGQNLVAEASSPFDLMNGYPTFNGAVCQLYLREEDVSRAGQYETVRLEVQDKDGKTLYEGEVTTYKVSQD
jgi:hypothetical protein